MKFLSSTKIILVFKLMIFCVINAQEPSFSAAPKPIVSKLNPELRNAIESKNIAQLESFLLKKPKEINDPVSTERKLLDNGIDAELPVPAIHYLVQKYVEGKTEYLPLLQWYIKQPKTDINAEFQQKNIFYYLLDRVAVKTIETSKKETEILTQLLQSGRISLTQTFKNYALPFSYLINTHFAFMKNEYNPNYIDSTLLILFLEKGAPLETYDEQGNNLMAFALTKNDNELINYLLSHNINVNKTNTSGKDPLYFAVKNHNEQMVTHLLSKLNKKVTPSYLYMIDVHLLDVYKSPKIAQELLKECYANLNDVSDLIIFAKIFQQDKNKLLNPIPIVIPEKHIPDFIGIFDENSLNASEKVKIKDLKIKYLNTATNFADLQLKLSRVPLFTINNYYTDDNKMLENNKLALLKKEIDGLSQTDFYQLKNTLYDDFNRIVQRCQNIEENRKTWDDFNKNIVNTHNYFWIGQGDGATFWEAASINENSKFKKYKLCLISRYKNNSNRTHKIKVNVLYNYKGYSKAFLFNNTNDYSVMANSYIEIGPKEELPVVTIYDFKETYNNYGILSTATVFNEQNPYSVSAEPYFGVIDNQYIIYQNNLQRQLRDNGKLETKKGWDDTIKFSCDNCIIDEKKSEGPKWQIEGIIWKNLVEKEGKIVMKNGKQYNFKKVIKNNKIYYRFVGGFLEQDEDYESFEKMLNIFLEKCKANFCN